MSWKKHKKIISGIQCGRASGCVRERAFRMSLETREKFQQRCEEESKKVEGRADLLSVWQRTYELHPSIYRHALHTLGALWNIRSWHFFFKKWTNYYLSRIKEEKHKTYTWIFLSEIKLPKKYFLFIIHLLRTWFFGKLRLNWNIWNL